MALEQNSAVPLYRQLEEILLQQIETGALTPGSKLPTEIELSQKFGVSRVTVRKALEELSHNCFLERRSGKGTFIAAKKLERSISGITSFSNVCRMQNMRPDAKTIRLDYAEPTEEEREKMALPAGAKIILLERLRFADGTPVTIELTKFPESFSFLFDEDLNHISMYENLAKRGILFTHSTKTLEILFASFRESKLLSIPKNHPLLRISSVVSDVNGKNIHIAEQLCVADKFKFIL